MKSFPKKLQQKLQDREESNALRQLRTAKGLVDFSSNDYLGFSKSETIFKNTHEYLIKNQITENGATGSRLLSGNHPLFDKMESVLSDLHKSQSALIFNSGYDANIGFFSSVPRRGDIILYDEFIHASIRDGISMSHAKAYKFKHNDLEELNTKILRHKDSVQDETEVYIVTESVFSMDGDSPDLIVMSQIAKKYKAFLIVDEAHAVGIFGANGLGLIQDLAIENEVFARLITFGKAIGCHGAVILGGEYLKQYLVNFARSFIYTTALSPHNLASIKLAYQELVNSKTGKHYIQKLHQNIAFFKSEVKRHQLQNYFVDSHSAIHCCIIPGNDHVHAISRQLQDEGFDVRPILSPTVPKGQERLRFCLHSYNSESDITQVLELLVTLFNETISNE